MSENYSFRSAMNGFNRSDVISFIENILNERETDRLRIVKLERDLSDSSRKIDELQAELSQNSAKNKNDSEKCDSCELVKAYEAKLGAAMFDAKRFSDILVSEANDKSFDILNQAAGVADDSAKKAKMIADSIKGFSLSVKESLGKLFSEMQGLSDRLGGFCGEVKDGSARFSAVPESHVTESVPVHEAPEKTAPQKNDGALNKPVPAAEPEQVISKNSFTIKLDTK